ncbi:hypothetical protein ACTWPT_17785 [Nonomuraea sp. 3N208]|uniref:hypothetical protein n=1 Tax=Nonomuraea sp. 3N208 TaxID=3457421 RepID=UPI003FCC2ADA
MSVQTSTVRRMSLAYFDTGPSNNVCTLNIDAARNSQDGCAGGGQAEHRDHVSARVNIHQLGDVV